jgi:hypothetical protein
VYNEKYVSVHILEGSTLLRSPLLNEATTQNPISGDDGALNSLSYSPAMYLQKYILAYIYFVGDIV